MKQSISGLIRSVAMDTREAGITDFIKRMIPGLPSKKEALKTVSDFMAKDPKKFDKLTEEIGNSIDTPGDTKTAFDIKSLTRNLKSLADPKVIMALITLMGAFNTVDAGKLRDRINQNKGQQEQAQVKPQEAKNAWAKEFIKQDPEEKAAIITIGNDTFAVGAYDMGESDRDPNFAVTLSTNRAQKIAQNKGYKTTSDIKREKIGPTIITAIKVVK
jgi:hypothetical protein